MDTEIVEKQGVAQKSAAAVIESLEALGFTAAAKELKSLRDRKRKMAIAYEHYRYIRPEKIIAFQAKLREKTYDWDNRMGYHMLQFEPISVYKATPPESVLTSLVTAQGHKCFDSFEVASIKEVEDPLLLGRIEGCPDRFFIDQWDNDVKISDILGPNEG